MKLLKIYIRECLKEGAVERGTLGVQEIVNTLRNRIVIFIDTETTGLNPRKDYALITEIAAIAIDMATGQHLGEYNEKAELSPAVLDRIEKEKQRMDAGEWDPRRKTVSDILQMTGYSNWSKEYMKEAEMLSGFSDFISNFSQKNPMIAAHNARFDMYQIGKALERHNLPRMQRHQVIDTLALVTNYLNPMLNELEKLQDDPEASTLLKKLDPKKKKRSLGDLGTAFNVSTKGWHTALADVDQLSGILIALLNFFDKYKDASSIDFLKSSVPASRIPKTKKINRT